MAVSQRACKGSCWVTASNRLAWSWVSISGGFFAGLGACTASQTFLGTSPPIPGFFLGFGVFGFALTIGEGDLRTPQAVRPAIYASLTAGSPLAHCVPCSRLYLSFLREAVVPFEVSMRPSSSRNDYTIHLTSCRPEAGALAQRSRISCARSYDLDIVLEREWYLIFVIIT